MRSHTRTLFWLVVFVFLAVPLGAQERGTGGFAILLSNDDGYDAPGLKALVEALEPVGEIFVAAPADEQSGTGHAVALRAPVITVDEREAPSGTVWYAIDGPPAACVRLALEALLTRRPDVVISGINRGDNLGSVVYYSGTLGAAREAALVGVPAIAVSMRGDDEKDYAAAAAYVRQLVEQLRAEQLLKPGFFLNVNVPAGERKGVRLTRLSMTPRPAAFERRVSPRGRLYFWRLWPQFEDDAEGTDVWAFARGYITLTPMSLDVTASAALESLRALELEPVPVVGAQ